MATIAPWLLVDDGERAVAFYREALGASVGYRLDDGDRVVVAQLDVEGAAFWVQEEAGEVKPARLILTVDDPDAWFARAVAAGATIVAAVHDEHGWRTSRVTDPFGHDWELSRPSAG